MPSSDTKTYFQGGCWICKFQSLRRMSGVSGRGDVGMPGHVPALTSIQCRLHAVRASVTYLTREATTAMRWSYKERTMCISSVNDCLYHKSFALSNVIVKYQKLWVHMCWLGPRDRVETPTGQLVPHCVLQRAIGLGNSLTLLSGVSAALMKA